jgi:hypothetical protein
VEDDQIIAFGVVAAYLMVLWVTRWRFVARPNILLATAKLRTVESRCTDGKSALVEVAQGYLDQDKNFKRPHRLVNAITWSGSRELLVWWLAHEVEQQAVVRLEPAEVKARLARGRTEIAELPEADRDHWRDEFDDALGSAGEGDEERARATLKNFLKALYDRRHERFVELATAENKVTWLILVALLLLVALISQDVTAVLAAGAIGGLLSRLQRVLVRDRVLSDYGMSWALLFLAPIAGALSAWAGLLLIELLQTAEILSVTFDTAEPIREPTDSVLAVALLLGFFERFFERLASQTAGTGF